MTRAPEVTVVIPTHRRPDVLRGTLAALARQTFDPGAMDVIVVCDGPDPAATRVIDEMARLAPWPLTGIEQPRRGQGIARNLGIQHAAGRVILMLDDDIAAAPGLVEAHLRHHRSNDDLAVVGAVPVEPMAREPAHHRVLREWWEGELRAMAEPARVPTFRDFVTGNVSVRREWLERVGAFDMRFDGYGREDYELGYRLLQAGVRILHDPAAVGVHRYGKGVRDWLRQWRETGRADVRFSRAHPELADDVMSMTSFPIVPHVRPATAFAELVAIALNPVGGAVWGRTARAVQAVHYWRGVTEESRDGAELAWLLESHERGRGARRPMSTEDQRLLARRLRAARTQGGARAPLAPDRPPAHVSVIVPAFDGAATLGRTLDSLLAQTLASWEAIVVDDGSTDDTAAVAAEYARRDARVRLERRWHRGVSAARNAGLAGARGEWILFLDADDTVAPTMLERALASAASDEAIGAVHVAWEEISADGRAMRTVCCEVQDNLFAVTTRTCPVAIHSCIVRRSVLRNAGWFDCSLAIGEDWDLWQRVARTGVRFGLVREPLARYFRSGSSASQDDVRFLLDGPRIIDRGHAPDARVRHPAPAHADGEPAFEAPEIRLHLIAWITGRLLAAGRGTSDALAALRANGPARPHGERLAEMLLERREPAESYPPADAVALLDAAAPDVEGFLSELERTTGDDGIARRVRLSLDRVALDASSSSRPRLVGLTWAIDVDCWQPISDVTPPRGVEALHCRVLLDGAPLKPIVLPVCNGRVSGEVIADAIAAAYAWPILGACFARTVYRRLQVESDGAGTRISRDGEVIVRLREPPATIALHDVAGWAVLLQEVWGRPGWPEAAFYSSWVAVPQPEPSESLLPTADWNVVEMSESLRIVRAGSSPAAVEVTLGGSPVAVLRLDAPHAMLSPRELISRVSDELLSEMGVTAVRLAVLGRRPDDGISLTERLRTMSRTTTLAASAVTLLADPGLAPRSGALAVRRAAQQTMVLARRPGAPGTSAVRMADLPVAVADTLVVAATLAGEVVVAPAGSGRPARIVYLPEAVPAMRPHVSASEVSEPEFDGGATPGRFEFDALFAARPDPWDSTSPYAQTKFAQVLSMIPDRPIDRALEIGCAEGHFARLLSPRVSLLLAVDISDVALKGAAARCAGLANVRFERFDLGADPVPGTFDLVVCSEVLEFLDGADAVTDAVRRIAHALRPGGQVVFVNTTGKHGEADAPDAVVGDSVGLRCRTELRTARYRMQLFERADGAVPATDSDSPRRVIEAEHAPLSGYEVTSVSRETTVPARPLAGQRALTTVLPILMYHRVAPDGPAALLRYRVTPDAFREQLRYLCDAGFRGATLTDWERAVRARRPLSGRRVMLTFDDGYADFAAHAWPLLREFGFGALVLLPTAFVGRDSGWDATWGSAPLMDWDAVRRLRDEGVTFGSHAVTHRPLTALGADEIVEELAGSRATLIRELDIVPAVCCYPYGDVNPVVRHFAGACGYTFGLSCSAGRASRRSPLLELPRIEVDGRQTLTGFIRALY